MNAEAVGGPEAGRPYVTRYWVCEDCGHYWAATLPDDEMPDCCESCQHRVLDGYVDPDDARQESEAIQASEAEARAMQAGEL